MLVSSDVSFVELINNSLIVSKHFNKMKLSADGVLIFSFKEFVMHKMSFLQC